MNQKNEVVKQDLHYVLDLVSQTQRSMSIEDKEIQSLLNHIEKVCQRSIRALESTP